MFSICMFWPVYLWIGMPNMGNKTFHNVLKKLYFLKKPRQSNVRWATWTSLACGLPCCLSSAVVAFPMMVHTGLRHPRSPSRNPPCAARRYPTVMGCLSWWWAGVVGADCGSVGELPEEEESSDFSVRLSWSRSWSNWSILKNTECGINFHTASK